MSDVPSVPKRIQVQEVQFRSPVSESTMYKIGGVVNFLLDNYAIPPGSVFSYAGPETTLPPGWIVCDGRTVSRTTYANLFAAIGTAWGVGDALTTFNVPDLRGLFLRGIDASIANGQRGMDSDAALRTANNAGGATGLNVGSQQMDEFYQHTHKYANSTAGGQAGTFVTVGLFGSPNVLDTGYAGGIETRSKNAYVLYVIKT